MNTYMLFTGSGPIVVLTSHASALDNTLTEKLVGKGIGKFIAYEIPIDLARERYGKHFSVVESDLRQTDDLRNSITTAAAHSTCFVSRNLASRLPTSRSRRPISLLGPFGQPLPSPSVRTAASSAEPARKRRIRWRPGSCSRLAQDSQVEFGGEGTAGGDGATPQSSVGRSPARLESTW
jgi:hypothetical protein